MYIFICHDEAILQRLCKGYKSAIDPTLPLI